MVALGVNSGLISLPQVVVGLRDRKLQEMFVASPISPLTYGAGIAMSRLMYVAAPLVVVISLLSLVGGLNAAQLALLLPLAVAGWIVGSTLGYVLALEWQNPMTVSSVSNMAGLLMTVFPPVYYPLALLPEPLHLPALLVPSANVAELLRFSLGLTTADLWRVSAQVAYLLVFLLLAAAFIHRKAQWEVP